jgi:uncharacterized membrane protein
MSDVTTSQGSTVEPILQSKELVPSASAAPFRMRASREWNRRQDARLSLTQEEKIVQHAIKAAAVAAALALSFGAAHAQNTSTPKGEDAEKNAFQTPTTGKTGASSGSSQKGGSRDANPESRLNDNPRPNEKVGTPSNPGK